MMSPIVTFAMTWQDQISGTLHGAVFYHLLRFLEVQVGKASIHPRNAFIMTIRWFILLRNWVVSGETHLPVLSRGSATSRRLGQPGSSSPQIAYWQMGHEGTTWPIVAWEAFPSEGSF